MASVQKGADRVQALIKRRGFFRKLMDHMQVGVIVSDHEGYIVYINDTYARFLNIDPSAEIGKHASELGVNSRLHIVAKTAQAEVNYPHQFKDRAFLVHRIPIKEDGKIIAVLGLVLFDSASTASKLAEKVSFLESKLSLYEKELLSLRSTRYTMDSMVGESSAIRGLKRQALRAAATSLPVVITGESGTGKSFWPRPFITRVPEGSIPLSGSTVPPFLKTFLSLSSSAMKREHSPARVPQGKQGNLNWPTMVPCS